MLGMQVSIALCLVTRYLHVCESQLSSLLSTYDSQSLPLFAPPGHEACAMCGPQAAAGTWLKWDGSGFTQPALGGSDFSLAALNDQPGSNPSTSWNTLLQRWVMVWASWCGACAAVGSQGCC